MQGVRLGMMTIFGLLNKNTSYMNYINYLALYLENRGSGKKSIILQRKHVLIIDDIIADESLRRSNRY